jgi:hypothetical protein
MEIEVYEKAMHMLRGVEVPLCFLIHKGALMGISFIKKDRSSRLKKQKSMVKQNKKPSKKCCLFFKQSRSAYKNSILSNTFYHLSTSTVDNF